MSRVPARIAAAAFAIASALAPFAPASANTTVPGLPSTSGIAQFVRSINPSLPFAKAQAYASSVVANALRTGLDPKLIMSIVTVESGWHANAVSRVGAQGLGQLMPGTARTLGVNPRVPAENLRGTSTYLSRLVNHFSAHPNALNLAIASYNAGPKAVEAHHGIPPYAETRHYVVKVLHVMKDLDRRIAATITSAHAVAAKPVEAPEVRAWTPTGAEQLPAAPVEKLPDVTPAASAPTATLTTTAAQSGATP